MAKSRAGRASPVYMTEKQAGTGISGHISRKTNSRAIFRPMLHLAVQYAVRSDRFPDRHRFRRWVRAALERDADITLRIVGETEGRALNREYRGRDYATNVLTFPYGENALGLALSGDVVLCAPVLVEEAHEQGKDLIAHCAHLVIHGVLHLQGYDHERARAAKIMEAREIQILARFGFDNPYRY